MEEQFPSPLAPNVDFQGLPDFYFLTQFRDQEADCIWPSEFSIITAHATTGQEWGSEENEAADSALSDEFRGDGKWIARITGYSPVTGHAEPGWAAAIGWETACDLGSKYKQDAIYHVKGDELFVSYCDGRRALVPVGMFRERLDGGKGTANP